MEWHAPRASVAGVLFDREHGAGATPNGMDVDHLGATVLMRPSAYLTLANRLREPRPEALRHLTNAIGDGFPVSPSFLSLAWPERDGALPAVVGHDGRHRMLAVGRITGDSPVPVHLFMLGRKASFLSEPRVAILREALFDQDRLMRVHGPLFGDARVSGRTMEAPQPPRHNHVTGHVPFEPRRATEEFLAETLRREGVDTSLGEALRILVALDEDAFDEYGAWDTVEAPDRGRVLCDLRFIAASFGPSAPISGLMGPVGAAPSPGR